MPRRVDVLFVDVSDEVGGAERVSTLASRALPDSLRSRRIQVRDVRSKSPLLTAARGLCLAGKVALLVRRRRVRCAVLNNQKAFFFLAAACRVAGARVVYHEHSYQSSSLVRWLTQLQIWAFSDQVICVSRFMADRHFVVNRDKVTVLHNGFDLPAVAARAGETDRVQICCHSLLRPWKGQDLLLEALSRIPEQRLVVHLYGFGPVVGDGQDAAERSSYERRVRELARAAPPKHEIVFHERLPDAFEHMSEEADIVVVPSRSPDPFPTTVIEAFAASKPVIAAAIGGIPEMVTDRESGLLFDPGSARSLGDRLSELIADRGLRDRLASNARRTYESLFTAERFTSAYTGLIESLCW